MRILKAALGNIKVAAKIVNEGGLVVYPTETVYGLGCDPLNVDSVERLIRVKGQRHKPLPILACSLSDVGRIARLSELAKEISEKFWPGPLTLVLPRKLLPNIVTFGSPNIGVRIPRNDIALDLIRLSGGILVGTSANKTGAHPPSTAAEAYRQLKDEVDIILDSGITDLEVPSTVLDLTGEKPKILRQGAVRFEEIFQGDAY